MRDFESEVKALIIEALYLETMKPEDIDSEAPLFREGMGLDSIDALELAIAIERRFGVKVRPDDPDVKTIFASVRNLASHIRGASV